MPRFGGEITPEASISSLFYLGYLAMKGRAGYELLLIVNVPPGHPVPGATLKRPFAAVSDAAPFAVMAPVDEPEVKLIKRLRLDPASIGCVTFPATEKVVPELVMVEMHEDGGLLTVVTAPVRLFPF